MAAYIDDDPIQLGYSVPVFVTKFRRHKHLAASWLVPCKFCGRTHIHGNAEGHRVAHCPPVRSIGGYHLVFGGEASSELMARFLAPRS